MQLWAKAQNASSFTILKGALINESYSALSEWNGRASKRANIERLVREKFMGPKSPAYYRNIAWVISRRFDPDFRDIALSVTARNKWPIHEWRCILLWHITRNEFLLRDFLVNWLFPACVSGVSRIRTADLYPHLRTIADRGGIISRPWSETTMNRVAGALLKMAVDFHLLRGKTVREFAGTSMPERSLIYLVHAIRETTAPERAVADAADWRIFLRTPHMVEEDLRRLNHNGKLKYEVRDGKAELILPYGSALQYATLVRL